MIYSLIPRQPLPWRANAASIIKNCATSTRYISKQRYPRRATTAMTTLLQSHVLTNLGPGLCNRAKNTCKSSMYMYMQTEKGPAILDKHQPKERKQDFTGVMSQMDSPTFWTPRSFLDRSQIMPTSKMDSLGFRLHFYAKNSLLYSSGWDPQSGWDLQSKANRNIAQFSYYVTMCLLWQSLVQALQIHYRALSVRIASENQKSPKKRGVRFWRTDYSRPVAIGRGSPIATGHCQNWTRGPNSPLCYNQVPSSNFVHWNWRWPRFFPDEKLSLHCISLTIYLHLPLTACTTTFLSTLHVHVHVLLILVQVHVRMR